MVVERPLGSTGLGSEQIPQFRVDGEKAGMDNAPSPGGLLPRRPVPKRGTVSAVNLPLSSNRL